jgi:hypothetical protein
VVQIHPPQPVFPYLTLNTILNNNLDVCDAIHLSYFYLPPKFHKNFFTRPLESYKTLKEINQDGNENDYIERLFFLDNRDFGGMWSYIMTKKGAKKILENINENNGLAIDTLLMKMAMEKKIVLCGVKKNLFTRGNFQSSYVVMKN